MACITYRTNEATCYVIAIRDKQEGKAGEGRWQRRTDSAAGDVRKKRRETTERERGGRDWERRPAALEMLQFKLHVLRVSWNFRGLCRCLNTCFGNQGALWSLETCVDLMEMTNLPCVEHMLDLLALKTIRSTFYNVCRLCSCCLLAVVLA